MLECVVNVSEGRNAAVLGRIARAAGACLLDVHADADHHRSVFTLAGADDEVEASVRRLAASVVDLVDLVDHDGAHPRIGALDVVPFIALDGRPVVDGPIERAIGARDRFAEWAAAELGVPCFRYGPERSLPEIRRSAWAGLNPAPGPAAPHPSAGGTAVGARPVLVAYNLWLVEDDLDIARGVASAIRGPHLRTLGLAVGSSVQVSCNLVAPWLLGPVQAFDAVARRADVARAELVGLIPGAILDASPRSRWEQLDLDPDRTIESRLDGRPVRSEPAGGGWTPRATGGGWAPRATGGGWAPRATGGGWAPRATGGG